jgi:hypothetical protein
MRRDTGRVSRNKLIAFAVFLGSVFAVFYPFWEMKNGDSIRTLNTYILIEFFISAPPAFFIYPKTRDKNLFFISTTTPLMVVGYGLGNLTEIYAPDPQIGRVLNLLVMAICFASILTGLFWLTRKGFPGLYETENPLLWRRLWVITLLMGLTQIVSGNVFSENSFRPSVIIPSRLICVLGTAAILYIAGLAKRQAEESAEAEARAAAAEGEVRQKEKAYARIVEKTEETNRLRHDRRQMLAAITGMNEPGKEEELIAYCNEVINQMKNTEINKAEVSV